MKVILDKAHINNSDCTAKAINDDVYINISVYNVCISKLKRANYIALTYRN